MHPDSVWTAEAYGSDAFTLPAALPRLMLLLDRGWATYWAMRWRAPGCPTSAAIASESAAIVDQQPWTVWFPVSLVGRNLQPLTRVSVKSRTVQSSPSARSHLGATYDAEVGGNGHRPQSRPPHDQRDLREVTSVKGRPMSGKAEKTKRPRNCENAGAAVT